MKKALLSCIAVAAGTAMAMAQALPEYPDKLDFTLNGQKELSGVTVTQTMVPYDGDDYLTITLNGESNAKEITLDIATPEGWDGMLTFTEYGESEDVEPLKAKAPAKEGEAYWTPLMFASWMGLVPGNTVTFPVDGEEHQGMAVLVKGEEYYTIQIDFIFEVKKAGGNVDADEPRYPQSLDFTLNGEKELTGVSVSQKMVTNSGTDYLTIEISGESSADAITMEFDTPKGWDYALISSMIDGGDAPFNTRSGDSKKWYPVGDVIAMGYKKGNSFEFPVDGKDSFGTIYLVKGDKVWEDSIDILINVKKSEGAGDDPVVDAPAFPDHLDYTLNGEKELPGITVRQRLDETTHVFSVKGECDSDYITVTFETPEGWDGLMISDAFGEGEISTVKTRGMSDLIEIDKILGQGFKEGNTITFKTDGEAQWGNIALIKGDMACLTFIDYDITVSKSGGSDEPGDNLVFPESFIVTTNDNLKVTQGMDYGTWTIKVEGEVAHDSFSVVLDVPEGWDGFISTSWADDVKISENNPVGPRGTRSDEIEMIPISELPELDPMYEMLGMEFVKGNKFTFLPTYDPEYNQYQTVEIRLYKGDMAMAEYFNLEVYVSKKEGSEPVEPVFPEVLDVTATGQDINVWQGAVSELPEGTITETESELAGWFYTEYAVSVSGKTIADSTTVEFNLPESWTGVQPFKMTVPNFDDYEYYGTRANESDWQMLDEIKATLGSMFGYFDTSMEGGTKFEFKADEKQVYMCFLYTELNMFGETYTVADTANPFLLVVNVEGEGSGVATVESAARARFYNLQGAEVANPESGVYVKVVNGKATKVIVK